MKELQKTKQTETAPATKVQEIAAGLPANLDTLTKDEAIALVKQTAEAIKAMDDVQILGGLSTDPAKLVQELNSIDFENMIGGPLQAVTKAQVDSSMATVNFLKETAFETYWRKETADSTAEKPKYEERSTKAEGWEEKQRIRNVDFSYEKIIKENEEATTGKLQKVTIKVPFVTILNIPTLRIEEVNINFNVKLNSVETSEISNKLTVGGSIGGPIAKVINFKVSASYQRQSTTGVKVEKEYTLGVNVKAVQDELPAGLEKILNLLAA